MIVRDDDDDLLPAELRGLPVTRPFWLTLTDDEKQALLEAQAGEVQRDVLDFDPLG